MAKMDRAPSDCWVALTCNFRVGSTSYFVPKFTDDSFDKQESLKVLFEPVPYKGLPCTCHCAREAKSRDHAKLSSKCSSIAYNLSNP